MEALDWLRAVGGSRRSVATKKQVWTRHVAVLQDASNYSRAQERHAESRIPAEQPEAHKEWLSYASSRLRKKHGRRPWPPSPDEESCRVFTRLQEQRSRVDYSVCWVCLVHCRHRRKHRGEKLGAARNTANSQSSPVTQNRMAPSAAKAPTRGTRLVSIG